MSDNRNLIRSRSVLTPVARSRKPARISICFKDSSVSFGLAELSDPDFLDNLIAHCPHNFKPIVNLKNLTKFRKVELNTLIPRLMKYSQVLRWSFRAGYNYSKLLIALESSPVLELSELAKKRLVHAAKLIMALTSEVSPPRTRAGSLDAMLFKLGLDMQPQSELKAELEQLRIRICGQRLTSLRKVGLSTVFTTYTGRIPQFIPTGYTVTSEGVYYGDELVTATPVVVLAEIQPPDSSSSRHLRLLIQTRGKSQSIDLDKVDAVDHRKVKGLLGKGVQVFPENVQRLTNYFTQILQDFGNQLPRIRQSDQTGFVEHEDSVTQGTKPMGFLYGREFISAAKEHPSCEMDSAELWLPNTGATDLQKSFQTKGTLEGWLSLVRDISGDPVVRFMTVASFAAPLLRILDQPAFLFSLAGESGTGKTAALQIAASAWGNPAGEGSLIRSFQTTENALLSRAATLRDLAMFIDETTLVRKADNDLLERLVYSLANGTQRDRLKNGLPQAARTTRTIPFVTGETSLISMVKQQGALRRILEPTSQPFGDRSPETGKRVLRLQRAAKSNYGHAGRKFIRFLIENSDSWPQWKLLWDKLFAEEHRYAEGQHVLKDHIAAHLATIRVANRLMRQCFPELRSSLKGVVRSMRAEIYSSLNRVDKFEEVFESLKMKAVHLTNSATRSGAESGWYYDRKTGQLWVDPTVFHKFTDKKFGLDARSVLQAFKQRGYLHQEPNEAQKPGGRLAVRKKSGDVITWWYVISIGSKVQAALTHKIAD